jgi:putative ABC transport system permease protein
MGPWFSDIAHDMRQAARGLARDRRFTLAAVIALALAIAVNNSVFALINAALIRDLPFDDPDRLVVLGMSDGRGLGPISYPDFVDWRDATDAFTGLAGRMNSLMVISEADRPPERFRGAYVSANAFDVLGVQPLLGRRFVSDDDRAGATGVVILSHAVWQRRYGADPTIVGRTVRVTEIPSVVVGVMPAGFGFPFNAELWQPLALAPAVMKPRRDVPIINVFGRLRTGVDVAQARAQIQAVGERLAAQYPDDLRPKVRPDVRSMQEDFRIRTPMFGVFMGAVLLVLLVACANLANLLLARSVARSRELALRASLGASRARLVRYVLVECALIAVVAGVVGSGLGMYGSNVIAVAFDPLEPGAPPGSTRPFWINLSFDGTMLLFVAGLSLLAALACALLPALHIVRVQPHDVLRDGARASGAPRTRRWTNVTVVAEIAVTIVLLLSTAMLWRSFLERYQRDTVIETSNLLVMRLGLPVIKYPPEARVRFYNQLEQRLETAPLVTAASIANAAPFEPGTERQVDGRAVSLIQTGARYFETIGLDAIRGRTLRNEDRLTGREAVVVDEQFASVFFADRDPLGERIQLTAAARRAPSAQPTPPSPWLTIVGVVATLPTVGPPAAMRPTVYAPIGAMPLEGPATIIVNGQDTRGAAQALREEVRRMDADLALYAIEPVNDVLARSRLPVRLVGTWFSVIALIAVTLVAVGLWALTAHGVTARTREIGIRVALGARNSEVVWLFARRALVQLAIGMSIGVAGALASNRLLQSYVGQISPRDPVTLLGVSILLVVVAMAATLVPARRALRVDPVVTLRHEYAARSRSRERSARFARWERPPRCARRDWPRLRRGTGKTLVT